MKSKLLYVPALFAIIAVAPRAARADDRVDTPIPRREFNARLNASLREVINVGASLYNSGDDRSCIRVYQGALIAAVPLLDDAALRKSIEDKMERAKSLTAAEQVAFLLREC